eukprot:442858-Pleurochrysis_carterae.AAC.1
MLDCAVPLYNLQVRQSPPIHARNLTGSSPDPSHLFVGNTPVPLCQNTPRKDRPLYIQLKKEGTLIASGKGATHISRRQTRAVVAHHTHKGSTCEHLPEKGDSCPLGQYPGSIIW